MEYVIEGKAIIAVHFAGKDYEESHEVASCDDPHKALGLILRARHLNDVKRQYTASARTLAKLEELPGFCWNEPSTETVQS